MGPGIPIFPEKKTKEGMVDSQPMEEEFRGAVTRDAGTETHRGPTEPVLQTQKPPSPSLAFIKENIDTSSDSEHEEGSKYAYEDLNSPYKRPKPTLFTPRITRFKYHRRAKLPQNIKAYEANKDLGDHLGIFSKVAEQKNGQCPSELAKKLNDKIPKTMDEMFKRVRAFIRGEGSQHQRMLSVKKLNRGSCGLGEVGSSGEGHPLKQPAKWELWKEWCKGYKHDKGDSMGMKTARKGARFVEGGPVSLEKTQDKEDTEEAFTISHERLDQYVTIGATLITDCKQLLTKVPRENIEIYPFAEPVSHKRRPMMPDERLVLKEKMFRWLKDGMIKKVQHPTWVTNTIPVKLADGTWKVKVDYFSLNKVCAKDMYPFSEEGEGLTSIMGYDTNISYDFRRNTTK
nr:hypothetical protein [Tanacetum cinerariifolium]